MTGPKIGGSAAAVSRTFQSLRHAGPLLLILLAGLAASPLLAQQGGEIDLEVADASGNKLAKVAVSVLTPDGTLVKEGTTNKKGKFKATVADDGKYLLRLVAEGFAPTEREVDVTGGVVVSGTLTLLDAEQAAKQAAVDAFNAGVAAIQEGDEETALAQFSAAAEHDPELAEAHRMVAAINLEQGNIGAASPALDRYLELKPLDLQIAPIAYEIFRAGGDPRTADAAAVLKAAPMAAADAAVRVFNQGVQANKNGETEAAIAAFEDAVDLDPTLAPGHQSLAALAFNEQDYETALPHLEKLLELRADSKPGLRMAFYSHAFSGHRDEALTAGTAWIEAAGEVAATEVYQEADSLYNDNQPEDARLLAELLVGMAPEYGRGHYILGRVLAGAGETAEAKEHLQHFIDLAPSDVEAGTAKSMLEGL